MDDKLLKLLTPLEKEEQTVVKLGSLLNVSSCSVVHQHIVRLNAANPQHPNMLFPFADFWH